MSGKIEIKELFKGLQDQMTSQLNTNRDFIKHPGSKGDSLENTWIEWLSNYLPNRYCVDKAIVVDSKGNLSDQLDLVIYDQTFTPFVFKQNGIMYIPAEGVYAVFEVKPDLSKEYIEYAGNKIESVRKLYRTSTSIIDVGVKRNARPLTQILGGILASESKIKTEKTITSHVQSLKGFEGIDIGCAVDFGTFYVDYRESYTPSGTLVVSDMNKEISEYYSTRTIDKVHFSDKENSLVAFFLQLMRYLQQSIGTVAAIDLNEYSKAIGFTIDKEL